MNEYVKEEDKNLHGEFRVMQLLDSSPPGMPGKSFYGRLSNQYTDSTKIYHYL